MARTCILLAGIGVALALALLPPSPRPAGADEGAAPSVDRVHLVNGRVFEGRIVREDAQGVLLELESESGGCGRMLFPRRMLARIERGLVRAPSRPPGCVRDAWYLLRSGPHVVGARRLRLRHVRSGSTPGWRLEETVEHFARGPHVPAVRIQRTELCDLAFRPLRMNFREVGEASPERGGPERYERIHTGPVAGGVWEVLAHSGGSAEQRAVALPPDGRGRLGVREHLLRRRAVGLRPVTFLDAGTLRLTSVRAGYTALGALDAAGGPYDEFVWEEDGVRLVSRYRECEILEEGVAEGVVATPATEAQVDAARAGGGPAGAAREEGLVQLADVGLAFRVPGTSWLFRRVEMPPAAFGWRKLAVLESRHHVADARIEWDPDGAAMAPGEGEAAARLLQRLRTVCPDLRVVVPRRPLPELASDGQPAWRMDFTGTLRGEAVRTVAVVVDRDQGRVLILAACPEVSWPQASSSIERLVASLRRL